MVMGLLEKAVSLNKCDVFSWEQLVRAQLQVLCADGSDLLALPPFTFVYICVFSASFYDFGGVFRSRRFCVPRSLWYGSTIVDWLTD